MNNKKSCWPRLFLLGSALGFSTYDLFCPPPPPPVLSPLDLAAGNATITAAAFTVAGCCLTCLTSLTCLSCCWSYHRTPKRVRIAVYNSQLAL